MMRPAPESIQGDASSVDRDLATTIEAIDEGDLLVVNDDSRTWEVTDVVVQALEREETPRVSKRAVRLQSGGHGASKREVFALILEEYPEHYMGGLHVLASPRCSEADEVYGIESVEILDTEIPWIAVRSAGSADTYHFPDPFAIAQGEARPACDGLPGEDVEDVDYRLARVEAVYPLKRACMDCARRHRPREVPKINCPACGRAIGRGLFHGRGADAVNGVAIECPGHTCDFSGVVNLADA